MNITEVKDPGFYWGRREGINWFNLIVEVYGEFPFFKCRAWDRIHDKMQEISPDEIKELGPRIIAPDDDKSKP